MPSRIALITPHDLEAPWKMLAGTIGERRAGSSAEHRAAEYVLEEFRRNGADQARLEAFECTSRVEARAHLEVQLNGRWSKVPCEVLVNSPSTQPPHRPVERELAWLEMPEEAARLTPGSLRGKALLLFGPLATNTENHKALVNSGAALVLWVDDRLPFEWTKSDALLPVWVRRHGALPTVAVAFRRAHDWRLKGVRKVRACVETRHASAVSYNVVADVYGTQPELGVVAFGSHYDTQCGNVGADDNGSGTVSVLALAKTFARAARKKPFARTLRFISFGTEEQLSVGARAYALAHRHEMKRHALYINIDSASSPLAHTQLLVAGSPQFERWSVEGLRRNGLAVRVSHEVTPFADHFPFNVFEVPSLWFYRTNCPGGRWQHHSVHDTLANVSPEALCRILNATTPLAATAADARKLPFTLGMRPSDRPLIRRFAKDLFDMKA